MLCLSWFHLILVALASGLGLLGLVVLGSMALSRFVWRTHEPRWWSRDVRF